MALTPDLTLTSDQLTAKDVALWKLLFRKLPLYQVYAAFFGSELPTMLSDAFTAMAGTESAKQLNGLMNILAKLDDSGSPTTTVSIRGDREATWYSKREERLEIIEEAFMVVIGIMGSIEELTVTTQTSESSFGVAVGQRTLCDLYTCTSCGCTWPEGYVGTSYCGCSKWPKYPYQ